MTQQGADVVLNNGGTMIAFRNAATGQFTANDFKLPLNPASLGGATFSEEFNSPQTISANWATNFGYAGTGLNSFTLPRNGEQQIYTSSAFQGTAASPLGLNPFSFNDGVLTITAQPVTEAQSAQMWGYDYSSGLLVSNFTQTYGYFEMRAELPQGQGLWPAFWLLGPENKEIDVLEGLGSDTKAAHNAIHSNSVPTLGNAAFNPYGDGFHTYGVKWTAQTITFYVDRAEVWQTVTPTDMHAPMRMLVNLAVGGHWAGSPDASTPFPANLRVDYIHAFSLAQADGGAPATPAPPPAPPPAPAPAAGGAGQVLTSAHAGATLTGGTGADTLIASQGSDRLTGGAGADSFVFKAIPWNAGRITDFQVGTDKLDLSGLYANGYNGSNPVADGYVSFVSDGGGGTKVLLDTDGPGGANSLKFQITTLDGVAAASLTSASLVGGGPETVPPAPGGGGQVLTSPYPGATLTGGSGADTLNASQGSDRLTGGAGADTFLFKGLPWNAGHITDFQVGTDRLNISALYTNGYSGANPVADGYVSLVSDGAGGTKVLLDTDGPGGANSLKFVITTLDGVAPASLTSASLLGGASAPAPGVAGQVQTSPYPGATLTGGAGADTLNASQGSDRLTGGSGADSFVFKAPPWSAGHVTDFTPGVDVLDLRGLFAASRYSGSNPVADGYLSFVADGAGGTKVMFDSDGRGGANPWPITVTTLDHVQPGALHSTDWLA
ncbi:MAG: family 16 glycosylhydrolase [Phenylobacterium sp.]|uniref:family 16 glycosylhydrolase n=1 Tax=Phenylobacterium sp. TaxID=1871053 RepID=UPI00272FDC58|nr:family 16 glycosylhydrolase [Phenylobacterium sp.]MDP2008981.1 family 16 glycosylhydrolase [Phenylobacterium sp.]